MEVGVILGCLWSVCVSGEDWLEELEEPPVPHLGLQIKNTPNSQSLLITWKIPGV